MNELSRSISFLFSQQNTLPSLQWKNSYKGISKMADRVDDPPEVKSTENAENDDTIIREKKKDSGNKLKRGLKKFCKDAIVITYSY